jgi:DNA-binding MarR family transcriptional regulator
MATRETTLPRRTADEAWATMGRLWHANKGRFFAAINEFDLSPPQALALRHLEPGSPLPMSALAELLHCDNSNITGIVDRLEDRGLVERRAAAHDRRIKHLLVTEAGADVASRLPSAWTAPRTSSSASRRPSSASSSRSCARSPASPEPRPRLHRLPGRAGPRRRTARSAG